MRALRAAAVLCREDESFGALVAELSREPEFASRWSAHRVAAKRRGDEHVVHPEVGDLRLVVEVLTPADDANQSLVTWLAADEATETALAALTSRRRLRLVQPTSVASRSS